MSLLIPKMGLLYSIGGYMYCVRNPFWVWISKWVFYWRQPERSRITMDLTLTSTHLSYVARSTHLLNISNYSLPSTHSKVYCKSSVEVDGFEWEIRFYPMCSPHYQLELQLVFLGEAGADKLTAALSCRMVDPSGTFEPTAEKTSETTSFQHHSDSSQPLVIVSIFEAIDLPYRYRPYFDSNNESLTVECTVTVFRDPEAIPVPSSNNLQQHLGELLASKAGSDVTFTVSGESFPAHKNVVAARSPVFMAEFFGEIKCRRRARGAWRSRRWRHRCSGPCFASSTPTWCRSLTT